MNVIEKHPNSLISRHGTLEIKPVDEQALTKKIDDSIKSMTQLIETKTTELENRIKALAFGFPDFSKRVYDHGKLPYNTWLFIKRDGNNSYCRVTINGIYFGEMGRNGSGYWDNMIATFPIPANVSYSVTIRGSRCELYRFECL